MSISPLHAASVPLAQPKPAPTPVAETGLVHIAPGLLGKTSRLRLLMFWIVGLMGFLTVILVVLHLGSLQKMAELIRSARPGWMLVALAVQSGTYVSAALVWREALCQAGHPLSLRTLIPLGIAKVFTDQVLPSGGVSGTMLVVRGLTGRRVPAGIAMAAMLAGMVSYDIAYLFVVLASTGVLWLQNRLNVALIIGVVIFVVVTVAVPCCGAGTQTMGPTRADRMAQQVPGRHRAATGVDRCTDSLAPQPQPAAADSGTTACDLRIRCHDAMARVQGDRRDATALGRVRELHCRVYGSHHWPHSGWPGDF